VQDAASGDERTSLVKQSKACFAARAALHALLAALYERFAAWLEGSSCASKGVRRSGACWSRARGRVCCLFELFD
jgi:hypothetical protein